LLEELDYTSFTSKDNFGKIRLDKTSLVLYYKHILTHKERVYMKKAIQKALMFVALTSLLGACSTMTNVEERKNYAMPSWYKDCKEAGTEGWFWWEKEFAYACGAGESIHPQAAEEQMYAIAMNNFAKRINSKVNSETEIKFIDEKKSTSTMISYRVKDTVIREHLQKKVDVFTMGGKTYTFVRLKMPKATFDQLVNESKQAQ
jgi:hypothetical protein